MIVENEMRKVQTDFIPGDRWLCYNIFAGPNTADLLMSETIYPICCKLYQGGKIHKWFFIRYNVPSHHLRLRLDLVSNQDFGYVVGVFFKSFYPLIEGDKIAKIEMPTYKREIFRYGTNTVTLAEEIFFYDSQMIAAFLTGQDLYDEIIEERWLFALKIIDTYLNLFNFSDLRKMEILHNLKIGFEKEFNINKTLGYQIDKKFRKYKFDIEEYMNIGLAEKKLNNKMRGFNLCFEFQKSVLPIVEEIFNKGDHYQDRNFEIMVTSYIHMSLNRLFRSKNRHYELVCYNFLYKIYKSHLAKIKM